MNARFACAGAMAALVLAGCAADRPDPRLQAAAIEQAAAEPSPQRLADLRRALDLRAADDPERVTTLALVADTCRILGRFDEGRQAWTEALAAAADAPARARVRCSWAMLEIDAGRIGAARTLVAAGMRDDPAIAARIRPLLPPMLAERAMALAAARRMADAAAAAGWGLDLSLEAPVDAPAAARMADLAMRVTLAAGRPGEARAAGRTLLRLLPADDPNRAVAEANLRLLDDDAGGR